MCRAYNRSFDAAIRASVQRGRGPAVPHNHFVRLCRVRGWLTPPFQSRSGRFWNQTTQPRLTTGNGSEAKQWAKSSLAWPRRHCGSCCPKLPMPNVFARRSAITAFAFRVAWTIPTAMRLFASAIVDRAGNCRRQVGRRQVDIDVGRSSQVEHNLVQSGADRSTGPRAKCLSLPSAPLN